MKTVEVDTFSFRLHISVGDEAKKVVQYINRKVKKHDVKLDSIDCAELLRGSLEPNYSAFYLGLDSLSGHGLIWFNAKHLEEINTITLSHEVIHACVDIFDHIGSNVNHETEENFCYLHDFLMKECLVEIDKWKNGNNTEARKPIRNVQKLDKGNQPNPET